LLVDNIVDFRKKGVKNILTSLITEKLTPRQVKPISFKPKPYNRSVTKRVSPSDRILSKVYQSTGHDETSLTFRQPAHLGQ